MDLAVLFERLVRLQVELFAAVDARLRRELDLLLIALLPLRVVAAHPDGCRVQEIADSTGITVGGASKSADRLERGGWVRRVDNPADRRSSLLQLTDEGHRVVEAGSAIVRDELDGRIGAGSGLEAFAATIDRLLIAAVGTGSADDGADP